MEYVQSCFWNAAEVMHGTIGSYNISAFWYLPKYANRWNKHSKWRSWARSLLLIIENSQQISTRPGSVLYRSIHSNIPIEDWQYIGRFLTIDTLNWHLSGQYSILKELQHVLAVFGRSSQSLLNIRHGCADILDRAKGPAPDATSETR